MHSRWWKTVFDGNMGENMPIKGAIIGFGHIAAKGHVPAYLASSHIKIQAVCDCRPDRKRANEKLLRDSRFYSSADELLEREDIDFVDISTPPSLHAPFILKALEAGRHVLCEKPLILDDSDLLDIAKSMKESGRTVVTVHNWRYSPILQTVTSLLEKGEIGNVEEIEYRVLRTRPSVAVGEEASENWRLDPAVAGGGILVDHGWHAFYLVNQWAGSTPQKVTCRLENRKFQDIRVEDTADVLFEYDKAQARLFFTWAARQRNNSISITGSQGQIQVMDDTIRVEKGSSTREISFAEGLSHGSHHPDWYGAVIREFLAEIKNPAACGKNFLEAACCFNLLKHCKESSAAGTALRIKDWQDA